MARFERIRELRDSRLHRRPARANGERIVDGACGPRRGRTQSIDLGTKPRDIEPQDLELARDILCPVEQGGDSHAFPGHLRQQFVQARLGQLRERLSKLSSIDVTQIPHDKVGLGSTVLVRDEKSGLKETYHLVFGDAVDFEEGHVTMSSPIGRALLGKSVGEIAYLKLPALTRQLKVTELKTIHDLRPDDL